MATNTLAAPRFVRSSTGQGPLAQRKTIVAGLIEGEQCVQTDNALAACADGASIVTHIMATISANVIPGDTLKISTFVARPGDVWEVTAYHSTPSLAVFADTALDAQPDYGIKKPTVSGVTQWCLDLENTTQKVWRVIARPGYLNNTGTDLYPRIWVQYLPAATQES